MTLIPLSWMELSILSALLGSFWAASAGDLARARQRALLTSGLAFLFSLSAWLDFSYFGAFAEGHGFRALAKFGPAFVIDLLNVPLLSLVALLCLSIVAVTLKTRVNRFSFARTLLLEALLLLTLSAKDPWVLIVLLGLVTLPQAHELTVRGRSLRVFSVHMGLSMLLLSVGWWLVWASSLDLSLAGYILVAVGLAIRLGLVPAHCWIIDIFENASFGTALLTISPLLPVYAAVRLLLPEAPPIILSVLAGVALLTALYAAAMGTIQNEARHFICYFLLSHSSLVLAGLMFTTRLGMTAGLFLWLSVSLSVMTLGLIIRCIEARTGRLALKEFMGFHTEIPTLAAFFLVIGLAVVGFPGTLGFFGFEMLTDAATQSNAFFGFLVIASAALNGIGVLRVYAILFLGARRKKSVDLSIRRVELAAFLALVILLIGGTVYPQAGINFRKRASENILNIREAQLSYFQK